MLEKFTQHTVRDGIMEIKICKFELSDVITLNVRGVTDGFKVSCSVLTSVKDSSLSNMFSGRHQIKLINGNPYHMKN
jgi:hypothetical protein